MKTIPLTQGKVALVDDADFEWLSKFKWSASKANLKSREIFYASRKESSDGRNVYMHRLILGESDSCTDHIDGDGLNNQRDNLRSCTNAENQMNRGIRFDKYKGVWFARHARKWTAQISIDGKRTHLGYFEFSTDAAIAYNTAATKHYGEFARLNQIPE